MQISFDQLEIMLVDQFMKHPKSSYLDLQFILLKIVTKAKNI